MSDIITARVLDGTYLGKRVIVVDGEVGCSGVLAGISHEADIIEEHVLGGNPYYMTGRSRVVLTLTNRSTIRVSPDADVEVLA